MYVVGSWNAIQLSMLHDARLFLIANGFAYYVIIEYERVDTDKNNKWSKNPQREVVKRGTTYEEIGTGIYKGDVITDI